MDEYKRRRRRSRAVMSMFLDSIGGSIDNVDVATFDSDGGDLKALVVGIELVQSGTGDPSPDNVRPITGHSSVNVIVSPTLNPLDGTITNIPLGQTVYGGTLDVLTGVLTVDMKYDQMTYDFISTRPTDDIGFTANVSTFGGGNAVWVRNWNYADYPQIIPGGIKAVCNAFRISMHNRNLSSTQYRTYFDVGSMTSVAEFLSAVQTLEANGDGLWIAHELLTPTTVQLTGQQIATLIGTNNVWCDSGKIIHLEY